MLEQNIQEQPGFIASRNNLAICYFHEGEFEAAVLAVRETCELAPNNRFAEASLIKFEFLTGNQEKANELASKMLATPPKEQDAFTAMVEALSFLGRDEDLVGLSQVLDQVQPIDDVKAATVLHHFAVARFRLNDKDQAMSLWDEALELAPRHPVALENVEDIKAGGGHAAWGEPFGKWLPQQYMKGIVKQFEDEQSFVVDGMAGNNPIIAKLVPALLDRGDSFGREFAVNFARADASPAMLAALKDFAFSTRGPDALRHEALRVLQQKSEVDSGPHRFFSRGDWTQVKLQAFEITNEAQSKVEPWRSELLEEGYWAMMKGNLGLAERVFLQVLERDPKCKSARFNLAGIWQQSGIVEKAQKAEREIRKLHTEYPDYSFAALAVANLEAEAGNLDLAKQIVSTIFERPKLHASEAMTLFITQIQIALMEGELDVAESAWDMMFRIADENDSRVAGFRDEIDRYRQSKGF